MTRVTGGLAVLAALAAAPVGCSTKEATSGGSARGMIAVDGKPRKATSCSLVGAGADEALRIRLDDGSMLTVPLQESAVYYSAKGTDRGDPVQCEEARSDASAGAGGSFKGSLTRRCTKGTPPPPPVDLSLVVDCTGQKAPAAPARK